MTWTMTYYVITPFEVLSEPEFMAKREDLARAGNRHIMGVVFNCKDYGDFRRKWFGQN